MAGADLCVYAKQAAAPQQGVPYVRDTWGDKGVTSKRLTLARSPRHLSKPCPSVPRLLIRVLGSTRDGCFSGISLSWLQLGPARADREGFNAQTLTRSRSWTCERPVRGEHRSLRAGHEERSLPLIDRHFLTPSQIHTVIVSHTS